MVLDVSSFIITNMFHNSDVSSVYASLENEKTVKASNVMYMTQQQLN